MSRFIAVVLGSAIALTQVSFAQAESGNQWYLRGPNGGFANRVAIDPASQKPMAGGWTGLFAYDPAGASWEYSNAGMPTSFIDDIATTGGTSLVANGGYIGRSTDSGLSWSNVTPTAIAGKVYALATSAASSTRVYVAVNPGDPTNSDLSGGLWISNDKGATWAQSPMVELRGMNLKLVYSSPTNANLVFIAGSYDSSTGVTKMFRSTDGGQTFDLTPVCQTGGTPSIPLEFVDAAQNPFDANTMATLSALPAELYLSALDGGGEVRVSHDAGLSFSLSPSQFAIAPDPAAGGEPRKMLFDRTTQDVVYFATTWGVFKGGTTAAVPASNGMLLLGPRDSGVQVHDEVRSLAQASDGTLYAASSSGGIYQSTDAAANWSPINSGYAGIDVRMLTFQPGWVSPNPKIVLASMADPSGTGGIYRSTDGGLSWVRSSIGMNANNVRGIAFSPIDPNVVVASGFPQANVSGEYSNGVWRSADAGISWSKIMSGLRYSNKRITLFDPNDPSGQRVLIASADSLSLSTDAGQTWINSLDNPASFSGLPTAVAGSNVSLLGLAAGPQPPAGTGTTRFYASFLDSIASPPPGGEGGVYISDDGGYTWTRSSSGLPYDSVLYFAKSPDAGTLFVAKTVDSHAGGVFKSIDYGATWQDSSAGLISNSIFTVAADPVDPNVVWAASTFVDITRPGGIYRSNDGGGSWVPYGRGLRNLAILWMTVDPADANHLLAGGYEGINEMHFATDSDQDGIPDSEEAITAPNGDANGDGIPDANQSNVASTPIATGPIVPARAINGSISDYVVVEIDHSVPFSGTCQFVSELNVVPTNEIPLSNRMQQAAPTVRFILPNCDAATVKIRYSALTSYPAGVFGSYSPATPGDAATLHWGLFDASQASVDGGTGTWTLHLDQNGYGNVYQANSHSILVQAAPGRDSIFANGFQ